MCSSDLLQLALQHDSGGHQGGEVGHDQGAIACVAAADGSQGFPNAAHDDLVDAFCQGVIWLQNQHCRKAAALLPLMEA